MSEEAVEQFAAITGASQQVARHYLEMTDGNLEQGIQLFFDSPDLGSGIGAAPPSNPPRANDDGVIQIDSDDDNDVRVVGQSSAPARGAAYEDDEAMARRMQEELYAGGDSHATESVRAPIARTTETLVGPGADWGPDDMPTSIFEQLRARQQGRRSIFNQQATSSATIWDESSADAQRRGLAESTGGESERSSKAARLAELFRPPFELISRLSWDEARDEGKEEEKWILVNVQDPSIFDCQSLNRDIWKNESIKETVRENFIFMQYNKDDPRGSQYIQYYFAKRDSEAAYPHIAIVDPRTGEQVKVWSGPPVPSAGDFLMQLHEFLDRYSLKVTAKNPVAKRKPEGPASIDVDRLTEEEQLNLALQNSLANGSSTGPKDQDPDDLTRSFADIKGKGKEEDEMEVDEEPEAELSEEQTLFNNISSSNPHAEPANDPATVTRIQFRHSNGRIIRRFALSDPVSRIYEWLKAEPLEGKQGVPFELKSMGKDLITSLDQTVADAGLRNGTVMVEYIES